MVAGAPAAAAQLAPEPLAARGLATTAVTRGWPSTAVAVPVRRAAAWALSSVWARAATSGAAVEALRSAAVRMVKLPAAMPTAGPPAGTVPSVKSPEAALQPQSAQKSGRHLPMRARRQAPDLAMARCVAVSDQIG